MARYRTADFEQVRQVGKGVDAWTAGDRESVFTSGATALEGSDCTGGERVFLPY